MTNTVTFNSANPYLDPIMEVFNSNEKGKEITADDFKNSQIQLVNDAEQGKFYKELNDFIKKAKKVATDINPKDKDIENLQKKKKEIVGMVKSNYDELLKTILKAIDENDLKAQAEEIKKRINEDSFINEIDKYNLTTLITEAIELEKKSNGFKQRRENNKQNEDEIKNSKQTFFKENNGSNIIIKKLNEKTEDITLKYGKDVIGIKPEDLLNIDKRDNNIAKLQKLKEQYKDDLEMLRDIELYLYIIDNKEDYALHINKELQKKYNEKNENISNTYEEYENNTKILTQKARLKQAVSNCEKQKTQLELALDIPIACCFNISIKGNDNSYTKNFIKSFNKGLCSTTVEPQVEETLQQIQDFCDIIKQVINTNEFSKYVRDNKYDKVSNVIIDDKLKKYFLTNDSAEVNILGNGLSFLTRPTNALGEFISIFTDEETKSKYISNLINILSKTTELFKSTCNISQTSNKEEIERIGGEIITLKKEIQKILVTEYNRKIDNLQAANINDFVFTDNKLNPKNKQELIEILNILEKNNPPLTDEQKKSLKSCGVDQNSYIQMKNQMDSRNKLAIKLVKQYLNGELKYKDKKLTYVNKKLNNCNTTTLEYINEKLQYPIENIEIPPIKVDMEYIGYLLNTKFKDIASLKNEFKKYTNNIVETGILNIFTETSSFVEKNIKNIGNTTEEQKKQLTWNKIYVDRANPNVAQQQDCIKAIQDISTDNSSQINKVLINEVINDEKNYEGLTKIHGTDHNEAQNEINIENDTIIISEKNKTGGNVKNDKIITISDYVINKECHDKDSKKRINLLKTDDNRPTNELASLLKQISTLKTSQSEVYTYATKQIAKLIKEKIITEQIKDGKTIKNEFPNTTGGIVLSALKNLYDTRFNIKDPEEKAVGETFGDVIAELKALMGEEEYESDFEEKVNKLIKSSKKKVEEREKAEREEKEKKELEKKASEEVQKLFDDYNKYKDILSNSNIPNDIIITNTDRNINEITKLTEEFGKFKKKFGENGEFALVENVEISVEGIDEKQELTKENITKKINDYEKALNTKKQQQINILKPAMQSRKTELLNKAKELTDKVAQQENINEGLIQLEKNIDDYNELVEKYDNILNPNETGEAKNVKPIVSNEEGEYKNLLIAIKTAEYKKNEVERQKQQQEEEEKHKKEEEDKKLEEEKKKKKEELKNKIDNLKTIKCKTKQQQDGKEVEIKGEKDIIANQQNIETQIGEVGSYYNNYNPIITTLKKEDPIETLEKLGLSEDCGVAELIEMLEGFEKNVGTLGSNKKYFKGDAGEDKGVKQKIFNAQKKVVANIKKCFKQSIFVEKQDNIGKDPKNNVPEKRVLENLIKQGQYINSLVDNAKKVKEREKQPEGIGDLFNDDNENDNRHNYNIKLNEKLKPIQTNITNATKDEEGTILKKIIDNSVELKDKKENKEGEPKQQTIKNTEDINIDEELNKLKEDTKKLNEELLTVDEIKEKADKIKEQYEAITNKLENPNEQITPKNYDEKTIEQTIKKAQELQTEIQKFTADDGAFKAFKGELGVDFDKDENDDNNENNKPKSKLEMLLKDYKDRNDTIKKENEEKKQKEAEEQKKKEIEKLANNHTENRQKQKLIEEAKKDKEEIKKEGTGYTALKDKFDKKEEIEAGTLDKKLVNEKGEESEQTNEQIIQENIKTGEELLEKLNKFTNNGKYKDILNENDVRLGDDIKKEEFENALKEYKNKYIQEKKNEIEELLKDENKEVKQQEQDINNAHEIFKKFEKYCGSKKDFEGAVTELKKAIKGKKKTLITQKIPELLTTKINEVTGKVENNSRQLKTLIDKFKQDFEDIDGIDDKIKEHIINNLLKTDKQTQVVDEGKLQKAYDIFKEFEEELKEQKTDLENKFKTVQDNIFSKNAEQATERNKQEEEAIREDLEEKIKTIKGEIDAIEIKDEESKKNAKEKLKKLDKLQEEIASFNDNKEENKQVKKVQIATTNEKGGQQQEEVGIDNLKVKLNKKLYTEEKRIIEAEIAKINNPTGDYATHCNNITTIRKDATEGKKVESLTEEQQRQLDEADKCLRVLIRLRKDADEHDKNTTDETYKEERLTGYGQSGTTNIQSNLTNKINNIKDVIFKTHRELLEKRIEDIKLKCTQNTTNLTGIKVDDINDNNLNDNVEKINNTFDLLNEFEKLIEDIEEVDKLIEEYNTLDKSKQEERLNNQKKEVEKLKQDLENSLNNKLNEINNIITSEVTKINNNKNKKSKEQDSVDYIKLKNACLAVVQILEHKFEGKDACEALTPEEQKQYVYVCMQLGWLNTLKEKESGFKGGSIESFKYFTKALGVLENNNYKDNHKDSDRNYIIEILIDNGVLKKAENELNKATKPIEKTGNIQKQIDTLKNNIKTIKKSKDINEQASKILGLKNIVLSNETQEEIEQLPPKEHKKKDKKEIEAPKNENIKNATPSQSTETTENNEEVPINSSPIVVNASASSIPAQSTQQQSVIVQGNNPPPPPVLEIKNSTQSQPKPTELAKPEQSKSATSQTTSTIISAATEETKQQNDNILKNPPKPAGENVISTNKDKKEKQKDGKKPESKQEEKKQKDGKKPESKQEEKKQEEQKKPESKQEEKKQEEEKKQSTEEQTKQTQTHSGNKNNTLSNIICYYIILQNIKNISLYMRSIYNNIPFSFIGRDNTFMPNNYFNKSLPNSTFPLYNMYNNLNSSLNSFNLSNNFNNHRLF